MSSILPLKRIVILDKNLYVLEIPNTIANASSLMTLNCLKLDDVCKCSKKLDDVELQRDDADQC